MKKIPSAGLKWVNLKLGWVPGKFKHGKYLINKRLCPKKY
jgi:hypothetical protein